MSSPAERFESKVDRSGDHHLWLGGLDGVGRGEPSRVSCTLGWLGTDRLFGRVVGIVGGLGFGGCDASEAVHEAVVVEPGDPFGGDQLDVAEVAEWAASER